MEIGNQMTNEKIFDRMCDNCERPLYRWPYFGNTQYDNALIIEVHGGYAMFVESPGMFNGPDEKLIFCHDCAHELCDKFPGFNELIDSLHSHSHTSEYIKEYPDHYGGGYENELRPVAGDD